MREFVMLKQVTAIILAFVGMACVLAAALVSGKNISDVIHLRNTKAKRALGRLPESLKKHPSLHPVRERNSRFLMLCVVAATCFTIAVALWTHQ